jgi:hypothetical protein
MAVTGDLQITFVDAGAQSSTAELILYVFCAGQGRYYSWDLYRS